MVRSSTAENREIQLALGLGWFSLGLGLMELFAPATIARLAGVPERKGLIRLLGIREIISGFYIFSQRRPARALRSRVVGDMVDLSLLGTALLSNGSQPNKIITATAAVAGVTALDVYCSRALDRNPAAKSGSVRIEKAITINRSPEDLYAFWRRFESLPEFMNHLKSVQPVGENRWHWVAKGPLNTDVEWDAMITEDRPNELIAWRSVPGAEVENSGTVRFERATGGRGTVVRVLMEYSPTAGVLGATVAKLFGEAPEKQVPVELHRFKQLMEVGEIVQTEGQPAGRSRSTSRKYDDLVRQGS